MDQAAAIRALQNARNYNRSAKRAREKADEATEEAVVEAFKAGLRIGQIAAELELSESKIRIIRDKHGIAPDPRYAHLRPPARGDQESAS